LSAADSPLRRDLAAQLIPPLKKFRQRKTDPLGAYGRTVGAKHLPETSGAGCAFFDFDNDGWMDIYLVNSGKCDFYNPAQPLRNALYKKYRDGTFTDVTEKAGVPAADTEWRRGRRLQQRRICRSVRDAVRRSILYRNNGDGTFTDVTKKRALRRRDGRRARFGSTMTTTGRLDLFVGQFCEFTRR